MIGISSRAGAPFGWAAARTDDLFNLIPARLSGCLLALAAAAAGALCCATPKNTLPPMPAGPKPAMAGG